MPRNYQNKKLPVMQGQRNRCKDINRCALYFLTLKRREISYNLDQGTQEYESLQRSLYCSNPNVQLRGRNFILPLMRKKIYRLDFINREQ